MNNDQTPEDSGAAATWMDGDDQLSSTSYNYYTNDGVQSSEASHVPGFADYQSNTGTFPIRSQHSSDSAHPSAGGFNFTHQLPPPS